MSSQTKILVIHRRIILYLLLALFLVSLLIVLLCIVLPEKEDSLQTAASFQDMDSDYEPFSAESQQKYVAGVYSSCLQIGDGTYALSVYLDEDQIKNIRLQPADEIVSTMYPFIEPTLQNLTTQILEKQTVEQVTYDTQFRYTSLALLQAIQALLQRADFQNTY